MLATNEAVFGAVAATFRSLAAAVLPTYRVRLRKVRLLVVGAVWGVVPLGWACWGRLQCRILRASDPV